jgi:hypothetical protein
MLSLLLGVLSVIVLLVVYFFALPILVGWIPFTRIVGVGLAVMGIIDRDWFWVFVAVLIALPDKVVDVICAIYPMQRLADKIHGNKKPD